MKTTKYRINKPEKTIDMLKFFLARSGISIQKVSEKLGKSRQHIHQTIANYDRINITKIKQIIGAMNELCNGAVSEQEEQEIVKVFLEEAKPLNN